jgi:Na+-transporting NADH:ubiquinone oxidoreductase subunit C
VLLAAGLIEPGEKIDAAQVRRIFQQKIETRLVDLKSHDLVPPEQLDPAGYDQRRARNDPATGRAAPENRAGISRLPPYGLVYFVKPEGKVEQVVLSIEGLGMWGTVYGFIALAPDANTVTGLAFYDQKETPGLGGEIANPQWQALWRGRKVYDDQWQPQITVVKGPAGPAQTDPYRVDGLSGASITSNAITRLVQFWLSDSGYGHWLKNFRERAQS